MNEVVLDASALLAYIQDEPGSDVVAEAVAGATISAVNLSEVIARLLYNMSMDEVKQIITRLDLEIIPFDMEQAFQAAELRPPTRHLGLSLGDRACLQLARTLGKTVLTADRAWFQLTHLQAEVKVIR